MIKRSGKWWLLIAGVSSLVGATRTWAVEPGADAAAAQAAAQAVLSQFGSSEGITKNATQPLTTGAQPLTSIDGSKSGMIKIDNPVSAAFLTVTAQVAAGGDLFPLTVSQDLNFDGQIDYRYSPPFAVSGVCSNGVMRCDPGTWNNCLSYRWMTTSSGSAKLEEVPLSFLAGCSCVNQSCAGVVGQTQILPTLGAAVVQAVQRTMSGVTLTQTAQTGNSISYGGQNQSGTPSGTLPQSAYQSAPATIPTATAQVVANQVADPKSPYSLVSQSYAKKGANSGAQSCAISLSMALQETRLADIIAPAGGSGGSIQNCGPDCIRLVLGKEGDNYWSGNCDIFEENYKVYVQHPELIRSATLVRAIWDDYLQVYIGGVKVFNGPDDNFPPETAGVCDRATNWNQSPNLDVTSLFTKGGMVDTKIRVSVTGGGEGYAYVELRTANPCVLQPDAVNDTCAAWADDPNCRLQEETVDGIQTWANFVATGKTVLPSSKTTTASASCSQEVTRDWWLINRIYQCTGNQAFDFSPTAKRMDTVTRSAQSNSPSGTVFTYTDTSQDQKTGGWQTEQQQVAVNLPPQPPACQQACKTRKAVVDSQAGLTGNSTQYQNQPLRYDTLVHPCTLANTCPAGPGEVVVEDCRCSSDHEFAGAAAAMSSLAAAGVDLTCLEGGTPDGGDCLREIQIFKGQAKKCLENGIQTSWFSCCNSEAGDWLIFKKSCPDESVETVQAIKAGRAHYLGTHCEQSWPLVGCVQQAEVYCVFQSKLGRIIQDQARLQLRDFAPAGRWGSANAPNCVGFTPEEFQMLDFSQLDLSEYFGDLTTVTPAQFQEKMNAAIRGLSGGGQ